MYRFARLATTILYTTAFYDLRGTTVARSLMDPLAHTEWLAVYGPPTPEELREEERYANSINFCDFDDHNPSVECLGSWED